MYRLKRLNPSTKEMLTPMGMFNGNHIILGNFASCVRVQRCVMRMSNADVKSLASVGVFWMCQSIYCANNPHCCSQSSGAAGWGGLDSVTEITARIGGEGLSLEDML
jgi:hypothetical protein